MGFMSFLLGEVRKFLRCCWVITRSDAASLLCESSVNESSRPTDWKVVRGLPSLYKMNTVGPQAVKTHCPRFRPMLGMWEASLVANAIQFLWSPSQLNSSNFGAGRILDWNAYI